MDQNKHEKIIIGNAKEEQNIVIAASNNHPYVTEETLHILIWRAWHKMVIEKFYY